MTLDAKRGIDCTWDGQTVWVNMHGAAIARFGRYGTDIHRPASEVMATGRQCLYCTHEPATVESWETFCAKMLELYGLKLSVSSRPKRLKVTATQARSSAAS